MNYHRNLDLIYHETNQSEHESFWKVRGDGLHIIMYSYSCSLGQSQKEAPNYMYSYFLCLLFRTMGGWPHVHIQFIYTSK